MNDSQDQELPDSPEFDRWVDSFFDSYFRQHPVNATFIGRHERDSVLPDYSESGLADTIADLQSLQRRARALQAESLSWTQQADKRLCEGFLDLQRWEYEQDHVIRGNPCLYTGEAIFGVMSLFLTDFAPIDERVASAAARLHAIPDLLRQARDNMAQAPAAWTTLAATECRAALDILQVSALQVPPQPAPADYGKGVERATRAFTKFGAWLEGDLAQSPATHYGCGEEALSMHLRQAHCLERAADDIVRDAEAELLTAANYLELHCSDFQATSCAEVLESLCDRHPEAGEYYSRYQQTWDDMQRIAEQQELLTWPDFPLRYVPQPAWARDVAGDLYFLFYRSPAAFNRPQIHDYLVTPIDDSSPQEHRRQLLRANNDSAIKLNHVVHHGGIGHHVQNWHAFRSASRVGQIAAVDCASRIALNCGGTMAEGWACYATDLMAEAGALTDREMYAEKHTRTRICARAIVDIRLHQGRMSFQQAIDFYRKTTGMSLAAASYETTRNSMYPGSAVIYMTGCDAIHRLRKNLRERQGSNFNLREFHDRFLSYGSIPVALIAENMLVEENCASDHLEAG